MAGQSFLALVGSAITRLTARQTGFGVPANAGQLVATGADDRIDLSAMPVGLGPDTLMIAPTEAIAAGGWINLYTNNGVAAIRNADSTAANLGKTCDGFILAAGVSGTPVLVYFSGQNTGVTGQVPGGLVYLGTAGAGATTPDTAVGHTFQLIGKAGAAGEVEFRPQQPILM